jgi:hypothetical protein
VVPQVQAEVQQVHDTVDSTVTQVSGALPVRTALPKRASR